MAALTGKWCLKDGQGVQAFFNAIGTPQQYQDNLRQVIEKVKTDSKAYVEELTVNPANKTLRRAVYIGGEKKRESGDVPIGSEIDGKTGDGRPVKMKVLIVSDNKITREETGEGFSTNATLEVTGNVMNVTITGNGATATLKYERA